MTFKWVLGEKHEIEENSQSPNINRNTVIRVADDLRSHVFLSTTMGFSPNASNRSGKAEICNFIGDLPAFRFEKHVFGLDVPMDEIFLVNTLEPLHDLNDNPNSLLQREDLAW